MATLNAYGPVSGIGGRELACVAASFAGGVVSLSEFTDFEQPQHFATGLDLA